MKMNEHNLSSDDEVIGVRPPSTKKKIKHGRMREVAAKLRLQSHETGPDCNCKKRCFDEVGPNKVDIIRRINNMKSNDEINCYLSGLITVLPVTRRRPRQDVNEAQYRDCSFAYRVRVIKDGKPLEIPVCRQAFLSLHGIGRGKLDFLLKSIKLTGDPPKDLRGKHKNRKHKLSDETKNKIHSHIKSFKARESHYSLKDTTKTYLPAELSVKKLHEMFKELHPDVKLSYETYRDIFNSDFNISFGYPRTDTCSQCDFFQAQIKSLEAELLITTDDCKMVELHNKIKEIHDDRKIHLMRADKWYKIKKQAKKISRSNNKMEAIVYDYTKNFSVPNITTNDVYYKRQLSVYIFNVHKLSTNESFFYLYPETVGNKGSDEVCSFLHHFYYNILDSEVEEIEVFSDSCAGQNKNNFVFKFYHHLVNKEHRFNKVTCFFPIRGHSYNECDKNCALIKKTHDAQLPEDWADIIRNSRSKPTQFEVIEVEQPMLKAWTSHLNTMYKKQLGCKTRPIRVFQVEKDRPTFMRYRTLYGGPWRENPLLPPKNPKRAKKNNRQAEEREPARTILEEGTFILPDEAYDELLEIGKDKYKDLQELKKFCGPKAVEYFTSLPHLGEDPK